MFSIISLLMNAAWSNYFKKVFKLFEPNSTNVLKDEVIKTIINGTATGDNYKNMKAGAEAWDATSQALNIVTLVLWIILAVIGVAGVIYSIYLGVKLARAEEQGKRDEAKKHLITVVIAIAVTLVLVVFFNTILPLILSAVESSQ